MTNPIPTAAIDAAWQAVLAEWPASYFDPDVMKQACIEAIHAAMPVIRKQIADEIRDIEPDRNMFNQMARDHSVDYGNGYTDGIHAAARIVEKGTEK